VLATKRSAVVAKPCEDHRPVLPQLADPNLVLIGIRYPDIFDGGKV